MKLLITGATGKVGRHFIGRILGNNSSAGAQLRALCHNRLLEEGDRLEVLRGNISDRDAVEMAMDGVTYVLHLATCKETPEDVMDVTGRGCFGLGSLTPKPGLLSKFYWLAVMLPWGTFFSTLRVPRPGDRTTEAQPVPRLLCAFQGLGRGDAGAVLHPI